MDTFHNKDMAKIKVSPEKSAFTLNYRYNKRRYISMTITVEYEVAYTLEGEYKGDYFKIT
ncbi:hypothetical protein CLPU_9c00800 [Gottschalkia purinilytica]|uniref:Uncharacterized protein n=1 Tax=Gottschalkia purinilytica TaxID=1503 RepID=A0A0L0W9G4_GOTPU|nr:hypothetical protein [Gottschalkia purinilytica]KNF08184.1 hypothetical protein CLPU_9c00800 [Gottschalkia purinilytica]